MPVAFEKSVFINCPFDEEFEPILQAIAFCVVYLGYNPRLAPENADNAAPRLERIKEIIRSSKFSIHDLSRCKSTAPDQYARMNMPFELGLDHACCKFGRGRSRNKRILVLEHSRYDSQKSLSDIAGWDIHSHDGAFDKAVRRVRDWLVAQGARSMHGPSKILSQYAAFQEWNWERLLDSGYSEDDIREYPIRERIIAMQEWVRVA